MVCKFSSLFEREGEGLEKVKTMTYDQKLNVMHTHQTFAPFGQFRLWNIEVQESILWIVHLTIMAPFDICIVISISYHIKVSTSLIENIVKEVPFLQLVWFQRVKKEVLIRFF
jgi:hypothetical protein